MSIPSPLPDGNIEPALAPEFHDAFASGQETPVRRWFIRLGAWLFSPPYLPAWPILAVLLFIAIQMALIIMQQPSAYWVNYKNTTGGPSINDTLLAISPLVFIAGYILYMLLIGLVLAATNRAIAMIIWVIVSADTLQNIARWSWCGLRPIFFFDDTFRCGAFQFGVIAFEALIWGIILSATIKILASNENDLPGNHAPSYKTLAGGGALAFLLLGAGITRMAIQPQTEWRQIQAAHAPGARTSPVIAYDSQRKVAVLFGGAASWNSNSAWIGQNDTWEWDGTDWVEQNRQIKPAPRLDASMAYDEKRGVTVLFGGQDQGQMYNDTWEWDGKEWHQIFPNTSPPIRCSFGMFYDPIRAKVVIYGGYAVKRQDANGQAITPENIFYDDAWEWDGQVWQQIIFDKSRVSDVFSILYNELDHAPMLMDGEGLWLWKEKRWTEYNPPVEPPGRLDSQLAYDSNHREIVLFGGNVDKKIFGDTWVYDGSAWKTVQTKTLPPSRYGHEMFFDRVRGHVIMFGGFDGKTLYNDTWELVRP